MVRFILVCMGIVAISILTLASQFMIDGIQNSYVDLAARNDGSELPVAALGAAAPAAPVFSPPLTATAAGEFSAEDLNAIDTAAGADAGNDQFGAAFRNEAPRALGDTPEPSLTKTEQPGGLN